MPAPTPPSRPRAARPSRRPADRPAKPAPAASDAWEDRVLGGVDRVLTLGLGAPGSPAAERVDKKPSVLRGLFSSSWKKAGTVEAVGAAIILLFVMVARPSSLEAAQAAGAPDLMEAVATQGSPDGAIVLADGRQVRLLGVALPTAAEQPAERRAAVAGIDRLVRGRGIRVEYDPVLPSSIQNGSTSVGYVWLLDAEGRRGSMLNAVLIANGLATPVAGVAYRHAGRFQQAEQLAQVRRSGMWR